MGVPNTNTFTLQNVVDVVNPTSDDLVDCFADAVASKFDSNYEGSKNQLLNFRNYDGSTLLQITMSTGTGSKDACNENPNTARWTDGSDSSGPVVGDTVYTNSSGTAFLASGNYKSQMGSSGSNVTIGSNGLVTARSSC
tara:strand:+ start:43 stop:459 length:417 start_codon:yes stop_codon:yes gene_type:complete